MAEETRLPDAIKDGLGLAQQGVDVITSILETGDKAFTAVDQALTGGRKVLETVQQMSPTEAQARAQALVEANPGPATPSPVTTEQTLEYQNREMIKTLLVLEAHLAQKCKIAGQPCDCCSPKHPLELQKLAEEAVTMSEEPVYAHAHTLASEIMEKASVDVLMTGASDGDLPKMAKRARDLRKRLMTLLPKEGEDDG